MNENRKNELCKVCLVFVIGEFIAGFIANSIAVKADAAHMLIDLMSFGVSLIALKLAEGKNFKIFEKFFKTKNLKV